jgi:hypothetical protein
MLPDDAGPDYKAEAFFSGEDISNIGSKDKKQGHGKAAGRAKLRAAQLLVLQEQECPYSTPSSTRQRAGENQAFTPALVTKMYSLLPLLPNRSRQLG